MLQRGKIVSNEVPKKEIKRNEIVIHKSKYMEIVNGNGRETQTSKQFPHPTHSARIHWIFPIYTTNISHTHKNIMNKCVSSAFCITIAKKFREGAKEMQR